MTLLSRWATAEPERVSIGRDCAFLTSGHGDIAGIPAAWTFAVESVSDPKVLGFIVAAIEARGWTFELLTGNGPERAFAVIRAGDEHERLGSSSGATPSEALLAAYLSALDAVEGEG